MKKRFIISERNVFPPILSFVFCLVVLATFLSFSPALGDAPILRRASARGKELPPVLKMALERQANGLTLEVEDTV